MPKAKPANHSYETLKTELERILSELQSNDLDVDKALAQYKRGLELVQQLEQYLHKSENHVRELRAKFDSAKP